MQLCAGENPKVPTPYVTRQFNEQDGHWDYFWGRYHNEPDMAKRDFHNWAEDHQRLCYVEVVEQAPALPPQSPEKELDKVKVLPNRR